MHPVHPEPTSNRALLAGFVALAFAVLVLTIGGTYGFVKLRKESASEAQLHRVLNAQELALVGSCQRLNTQRVQENVSRYADFIVFSFVEQRFLVPTPTETPAQKAVTRQFADALRHAVRAKTWVPRTDCAKAVNEQGVAFKAPKPIPFYKRLPPKSALR